MPESILSQNASRLQPSVFSKLIPKIRELGERCIPLHIGDTYRLPPKACLDALAKVGMEGLGSTRYFKYTHPAGRAELLDALVEKLERDNNISAVKDCLQITCGATQALCALAQTFLNPKDEVIVFCPHWPLIRGIVETAGGKVVDVSYEDAVRDPEAILTPLLSSRTKVLYLANPNNPDGNLLNREQADRIYRFAQANGLYIWSDEAYEHLVYDDHEKVSLGSLDRGQAEARVLSVFTFSKSFGMAGMRVGYVVGPAHIMDCVRRVSSHQIYDLSDINQEAALAAMSQNQEDYSSYLQAQRSAYEEAKSLLLSAFPRVSNPPGGAYLFVPFSSPEQAWETMLKWLEQGVSSAPGAAFGGLHPHCLRLCFTAVPPERLQKAVAIIKELDSVR